MPAVNFAQVRLDVFAISRIAMPLQIGAFGLR
jgi:hypothetical protein